MVIEHRGCEKCNRVFLAEQDGHEDECAVCNAGAAARWQNPEHLEEVRLQTLADIALALRALVDEIDKWRP